MKHGNLVGTAREKVSYVFEKPCDIGITSGSFVGMPGMFTVAAVQSES